MSVILGRLLRSVRSAGNPRADVGVGVLNVDNFKMSVSSRREPSSPTAVHNPIEMFLYSVQRSDHSPMTHIFRAGGSRDHSRNSIRLTLTYKLN